MTNAYAPIFYTSKNRTNFFRFRTADTYSLKVEGTAWEKITFFKLEPAWLTLPITLYVATTVLLICTIVQCKHDQEPVWKHTTMGILRALAGKKMTKLAAETEEELRNSYLHLRNKDRVWKLEAVAGGSEASRKRSTAPHG